MSEQNNSYVWHVPSPAKQLTIWANHYVHFDLIWIFFIKNGRLYGQKRLWSDFGAVDNFGICGKNNRMYPNVVVKVTRVYGECVVSRRLLVMGIKRFYTLIICEEAAKFYSTFASKRWGRLVLRLKCMYSCCVSFLFVLAPNLEELQIRICKTGSIACVTEEPCSTFVHHSNKVRS